MNLKLRSLLALSLSSIILFSCSGTVRKFKSEKNI